jgi:hypothetical protein
LSCILFEHHLIRQKLPGAKSMVNYASQVTLSDEAAYDTSFRFRDDHFDSFRELEGAQSFGRLFDVGRDCTDDCDSRVTGERGLKESRKFGVAERDVVKVRVMRLCQLSDDGSESKETAKRSKG